MRKNNNLMRKKENFWWVKILRKVENIGNKSKKIIENCDIILEVLDARDPMSCRCKYIERKILSEPDKKIILILNKIDLIPMENAYAWQSYLRREYPVVMFKANLQNQGSHLSTFNLFKKSIADST